MDSLLWTQFKNDIQIIPTTRKFYKKYLYKLAYSSIDGCHLIPIANNFTSLSKISTLQSRTQTQVDTLRVIYHHYMNKDNKLRWRFEGKSFSIFSCEENILYNLAKNDLHDFKDKVVSITRPECLEDIDLLDSGKIIMRTATDYKFKVTIRNGFRQHKDKIMLGRYLEGIRSEIKISDFLLKGLISGYKYFGTSYFYVNDQKIVDMILLVSPSVVQKVEEVVIK